MARLTKLPSYLKGLVESRARSAGDIERLERLRAAIDGELADARIRVAAADVLIREVNPALDPSVIQPVMRRKGRFGKHGALKQTLREVVAALAVNAVPTMEIAFEVARRLGAQFAHMSEFRKWAQNGVHAELCRLARAGEIEKLPGETRGHETRWRVALKAEVVGLEGLKQHKASVSTN